MVLSTVYLKAVRLEKRKVLWWAGRKEKSSVGLLAVKSVATKGRTPVSKKGKRMVVWKECTLVEMTESWLVVQRGNLTADLKAVLLAVKMASN